MPRATTWELSDLSQGPEGQRGTWLKPGMQREARRTTSACGMSSREEAERRRREERSEEERREERREEERREERREEER